jgi:hypothetical protein
VLVPQAIPRRHAGAGASSVVGAPSRIVLGQVRRAPI